MLALSYYFKVLKIPLHYSLYLLKLRKSALLMLCTVDKPDPSYLCLQNCDSILMLKNAFALKHLSSIPEAHLS